MMKKIGVIIELENQKIKEANWGLITLARQKGVELFAFVLNTKPASLKQDLEAFGITKIVIINLAKDQQNNPVTKAMALIDAIKTYHIDAIFGLSTAVGKDLLPRIAALLDAPLVMDCFSVDLENKLAKTSQYSGKTIGRIKVTGDILLFGVRPNAVEPVKTQAEAEIFEFDAAGHVSKDLKVVNTDDAKKSATISLAEADVIVAGGRGMKKAENFAILATLAEKLNAAVGASRVAVDSDWVPYSMQVGQTGEKVSPKVYIACGISGSIQHFAGMKTSGMVIALNVDENAAIMSICDYYAVADAMDVVPELIKLL